MPTKTGESYQTVKYTNQSNLNFNPLAKAKDSALVFLSHRDRSVKEMIDKLHKKGYEPEIIKKVIHILLQSDLLDDEKFAMLFSRSKVEARSWGPDKLRYELTLKGIDKEILEITIDKIYEKYSQYDLIRTLLSKRIKSESEVNANEMKKHVDFLKRRGYRWDVIREAIADIETLSID